MACTGYETKVPPLPNAARALIVLTLARVAMGYQYQSIGSTGPDLIHDFGLSHAEIGWLIGLYASPGVLLALPSGLLGARFGDRRIVAFGLALMALGGLLPAWWQTYTGLATGRLVSGVGAVLLNVLMTKMVTDWFAGKSLALAMAIFVNSYPIGIGLGLVSLGALSVHTSWQIAFVATAAVSFLALAAVALVYAPHPNDKFHTQGKALSWHLPAGAMMMVSLAGVIGAFANGAFSVIVGFLPMLLLAKGLTATTAGSLASLITWMSVISVPVGGLLARRLLHPAVLVAIGYVLAAMALLSLATTSPLVPLLVAGLASGLPVGILMTLPSETVAEDARGVAMGWFFTWIYVGLAVLPWIAGWLQDRMDGSAAAIDFAALLYLAVLPLFWLFHAAQYRTAPVPRS